MMVGLFTALVGLTLISTIATTELAYQQKVVMGRMEEEQAKAVAKLDEMFDLRRVVSSPAPEEYVKSLIGNNKGLKVYVSAELMNGPNPCGRQSGLRVRTANGVEHTDVAYVIVSDDTRGGSLLTRVSNFLDLSHVKGPVKIVKSQDFISRKCLRR